MGIEWTGTCVPGNVFITPKTRDCWLMLWCSAIIFPVSGTSRSERANPLLKLYLPDLDDLGPLSIRTGMTSQRREGLIYNLIWYSRSVCFDLVVYPSTEKEEFQTFWTGYWRLARCRDSGWYKNDECTMVGRNLFFFCACFLLQVFLCGTRPCNYPQANVMSRT